MTKIFARKKSVEHGQAVANAIAHNIQLRLLWSRMGQDFHVPIHVVCKHKVCINGMKLHFDIH